jgi:hypothetical protein
MFDIIFKNDKRLFGSERRNKNGKEHWHIILFHWNICLGFGFKKEQDDCPIIELFYSLCKKVK